MSLLTKSAVLARAKRVTSYSFSAASLLEEKMQKQASVDSHDIFLSHAFNDKDLILGVALTLEDLDYTVYLDWRDDPFLDRKSVTRATALKLRDRMTRSKCLFYATTENTSTSKWMPWELGFKDGQSSRSAILPVQDTNPTKYRGQEYLGIYPYITQEPDRKKEQRLWVNWTPTCYVDFDDWLTGDEPYEH